MKPVFTVLIMLMFFFNPAAVMAQGEFRFGLIGKTEFNRLAVQNTGGQMQAENQSGVRPAGGVYAAVNMGRHWFMDASVLLSRAKYTVNYKTNDALFMDADVRFTQSNLNLNFVLNPGSKKVNLFLFGGGQLLYRRWGEERFVQSVISNTYWPSARAMLQCGLGAKIDLGAHCIRGPHTYLQPFAGIRYQPAQQLVYDVPVNQVFAGIVIMRGKAVSKRTKGCNFDF